MSRESNIFAVAIRVDSADLTSEEISATVGADVAFAEDVRVRLAAAGTTDVAGLCEFYSDGPCSDDLGDYVEPLRPALEGIAAAMERGSAISARLTVGLVCRPMGFIIALTPSLMELLARAKCELHVDCYDSEE